MWGSSNINFRREWRKIKLVLDEVDQEKEADVERKFRTESILTPHEVDIHDNKTYFENLVF